MLELYNNLLKYLKFSLMMSMWASSGIRLAVTEYSGTVHEIGQKKEKS